MKKLLSCILSASMLCASIGVVPVKAEQADVEPFAVNSVFKHQNIPARQDQTCYWENQDEKTITEIPNVYQGMRINQPVFKAELGSDAANQSYTVSGIFNDFITAIGNMLVFVRRCH